MRRILLGNLVHVEIEHHDVRVVVRPPHVLLVQILQRGRAGGQVFGIILAPPRVAVDEPVGRAVDPVRIRPLVVAALEPAPDEVLDVVLERLNLFRDPGTSRSSRPGMAPSRGPDRRR